MRSSFPSAMIGLGFQNRQNRRYANKMGGMTMTRDGSREHAELLKETATGGMSRRAVLKRGLGLGLSLPALAGLMIARPTGYVDAATNKDVTFDDDLCPLPLNLDYDCLDICLKNYENCIKGHDLRCERIFNHCENSCWSDPCP